MQKDKQNGLVPLKQKLKKEKDIVNCVTAVLHTYSYVKKDTKLNDASGNVAKISKEKSKAYEK